MPGSSSAAPGNLHLLRLTPTFLTAFLTAAFDLPVFFAS